ncbi:MAG TPA: hypothetical protein VL357_02995 [Rariglobus sp.]|jgi:hypothetical protein|nr:hypothetical protein [Rariglobus sp.]
MPTIQSGGKVAQTRSGSLPGSGGGGVVSGFFRFKNTTLIAGTPLAQIVSGSLYDVDWKTEITIANLNDSWALSSGGGFFWLSVPVDGDTLEPSSTEDCTIVRGVDWPEPFVFAGSPSKQTSANYPLAKILTGSALDEAGFDFVVGTGDDAQTYHLLQLVSTNLKLKQVCSGSGPALYFEAYAGRSN